MFIQVLSKITSESLLSLYPIFVKKIGISSTLQLWSRLITYVAIAACFVDCGNEDILLHAGLLPLPASENFNVCRNRCTTGLADGAGMPAI
jgi:hypothetical protein